MPIQSSIGKAGKAWEGEQAQADETGTVEHVDHHGEKTESISSSNKVYNIDAQHDQAELQVAIEGAQELQVAIEGAQDQQQVELQLGGKLHSSSKNGNDNGKENPMRQCSHELELTEPLCHVDKARDHPIDAGSKLVGMTALGK